MEANRKFIKALEVKDFDQLLYPGDTIKIYSKETKIIGFSAQFNDGIERWETVIHTTGRGDPFERSLDVIEVLQEQPRSYEERANTIKEAQQGVWVKAFCEEIQGYIDNLKSRREKVTNIDDIYPGWDMDGRELATLSTILLKIEKHKSDDESTTSNYSALKEENEKLNESCKKLFDQNCRFNNDYQALKERAEKMATCIIQLNYSIDKLWNECNMKSIPEKYKKEVTAAQKECSKILAAWKEGEKEVQP